MQKVFTHENRLIVYNMKNLLEEQGIECLIKNEFAGGGVGDLAPFETWPELWVHKKDFNKAEKICLAVSQDSQETWLCHHCGESNDDSFQICWNCSEARPAKP